MAAAKILSTILALGAAAGGVNALVLGGGGNNHGNGNMTAEAKTALVDGGPGSDVVTPGGGDMEGGFVDHCILFLIGTHGEIAGRLIGDCGDHIDEQTHNVWLGLNQCLGLSDGDAVVWRKDGNLFDSSCTCTGRHWNTQVIECSCPDRNGMGTVSSSLDLSSSP
ncbi:hypothetical protein B0J18DRAFT_286999 [Chaetomium sp. MPI-SDFR-AT-0129]|nr:hypothetical protein B0J18DRAFT_286999 [Chaetomium sp. MPI-SDFR-AT-0129]